MRASQLMLTGTLLVVRLTHQRRDIRLDDAAAGGQQGEGYDHGDFVGNAQDEMPQDIRNCETDNGPVAAEPAVRNDAAYQGQEITSHFERGVSWRSMRRGHV